LNVFEPVEEISFSLVGARGINCWSIQLASLSLEVKLMETANSFWKARSPLNKLPCQTTKIPPDAPVEGRKWKLSKFWGQKGQKIAF